MKQRANEIALRIKADILRAKTVAVIAANAAICAVVKSSIWSVERRVIAVAVIAEI